MAEKSNAQLIAEIIRERDRTKRQTLLNQVQPHRRADVEAGVQQFWPQREQIRKQRR